MVRRPHVFLALVLLVPGCDAVNDLLGKKDAGTAPSSSSAEPAAKAEDKKDAKQEDAKWEPGGVTPPPAAEPPTGSWIAFESNEGGFKAEFPSSPRTETSQVPTAGISVDMVTYSAELNDMYFAVATTDFPDAIISAKPAAVLLDGARDGAVANIGGKLKEEKQIEVDGNAARRLVITGSTEGIELVVDSVLFIKGKRLYQGIVVRPANKDGGTDVQKFLDSLHPLG
jgi:hypothetical protein